MTYIPTTTVAILRGSTTDDHGDEVESTTAAYEGLPASIMERTRRVFGANEQQDRTVRLATGRLPAGTDVRDSDRIRDERTGHVYVIDGLTENSSPVHATDVVMELRRTT